MGVSNLKFLIKKKGVASIISIVLIIFITIVLIGILASFVFPLVRNSITFSGLVSNLDITDAVYDASTTSLFLSLKRNNDDVNLSGLKFMVSINGNSFPYEVRNNLPGPGEERSYQLSGIESKPDYVEVYAIAKKNKLEKALPLSDKQGVTEGKWSVSSLEVSGELPGSPVAPPVV